MLRRDLGTRAGCGEQAGFRPLRNSRGKPTANSVDHEGGGKAEGTVSLYDLGCGPKQGLLAAFGSSALAFPCH
jgi:hypothetical protein